MQIGLDVSMTDKKKSTVKPGHVKDTKPIPKKT